MKKINFKKIDYRHYICIAITLGFVACGVFLFPNAICRLLESIRDLILSVLYYFFGMFGTETEIPVTVNKLPSWQIVESKYHTLTLLPWSWEEFKVLFRAYWGVFFSVDALQGYALFLMDVLYYVSLALSIFMPCILYAYILFESYLKKHNNDRNKDSKALKVLKVFSDKVYAPIKKWILSFVAFLKEKRGWIKAWIWMWVFYFNFLTIAIEFFAFYLYFVINFDFIDIYYQVYKLLLDLATIVRFVPLPIWIIVSIVVMELVAHKFGHNELNHREAMNRGMLNERGIVSVIDAPMGAGKTELMTSMGISGEAELRDRAFDVIVECDFCFPNFPWCNLEREMNLASIFHVVYDLSSVRRWIRKKYQRWLNDPTDKRIFGYDYKRYGLIHKSALKEESIWEVLEDYACAFLVYSVQSSLILSNYSVRSDVDCIDYGNFPMWNYDYFHRKPEEMEFFSRRSHILDFDMLRFGKRVMENNPKRHALGYGVYLITEIDKERKNQIDIKEMKMNADEANQRNDLFNPLLKMIRHACVIRNRVIIVLLADLQRPEDWGAGGREVGECLHLVGQSDISPVLPFWAPFWWFEALYLKIFQPFVNLYYRYRVMRSDNTVPMYVAKGAVAKLKDIYEYVYDTFGSMRCMIEVEKGRMDGNKELRYWYKFPKKDRMERYGTACLQGMFEQYAEDNTLGLVDLEEYGDLMATQEELRKQHSYMQDDIYNAQKRA